MFKNLFSGKREAAQPQQNTQQPAQAPAQATPAAQTPAPNGVAEGTPSNVPNQTTQAEPQGIDRFAGLWDTPKDGGDAGNTPPQGLSLDSAAMNPVLEQLDFTSGLNTEAMQKVQQGDMTGLPALMQDVAKQAYSAAMQHSTTLVDNHLNTRLSELQGNVVDKTKAEIKTQSAVQSLNMDNPVIQSELTRVAQQLQSKYPDASSTWIAEQSQAYLTDLASAFGKGTDGTQADPAKAADQPFDFMAYAGQK